MVAQLLAAVLAMLVNAPVPERLDDPLGRVTRTFPEGRVLMAERFGNERQPEKVQATLGPLLAARAFLVLDLESRRILASHEPSAVYPIASLAKVLTAVTVISSAQLDEVATVSRRAVRAGRIGADMGLKEGERILVRDLLAGLLVPSANDAAIALAEHVDNDEDKFAERMEETAKRLGLSHTRVENATGFDSLAQFSSAYDVALLLAEAWSDEVLGVLLRAESMDVTSVDGRRRHHLRTTNRLLGVRSDVLGGKTGFTDAAAENLAVIAESETGYPVVAVVLGSPDRFADMENLLNWTFWAYQWPAATNVE